MRNKKFLKRVFIYFVAIITGYVSLIIFLGNPGKELLEKTVSQDIFLRRNFLVHTLSQSGSAANFFSSADMQYAGEWMLVTYSMATYALTNIAMLEPKTADKSSQIIAGWINSCLNEKIFAFDKTAWNGENPLDQKVLKKDRGHLGYYGHLNLMLGCYALLNNDKTFETLHKDISEAIARRMEKHPHRHVETYPYETYPADNTLAVASLSIADMTLDTDYSKLIHEWVEQSKLIEYQPYGLIAFQIDSISGKPLQTCRGSHIGWNSFFLPLIDEKYADIQFQRFKKHMLRRIPGFAGFKEYPTGNFFEMDCDTGPVIFGLGTTATGFSVAGARWSQDTILFSDLLRLGELFGTSVTKNDMRRYIVSPVVGDAIMLAMKTACKWKPLWKE